MDTFVEHNSRAFKHAEDKRFGMTLDELREFVNAADQARVPGNARVLIVANWKQSFHYVEVRGDNVKRNKNG